MAISQCPLVGGRAPAGGALTVLAGARKRSQPAGNNVLAKRPRGSRKGGLKPAPPLGRTRLGWAGFSRLQPADARLDKLSRNHFQAIMRLVLAFE
jgi:hypothetical protein